MSNETKIEWASHQWNPYTWNCSKVSEGCKNCYALRNVRRFPQNTNGGDFLKHPPAIRENAFNELKRLPSGAVVFVNSHSDTFHEGVSEADIQRVFDAMATRPDVQFLILTKRPERAAAVAVTWHKHIWLGTSVEMTKYLSRLDVLLRIPAKGHFLSAEPLLEPLFGLNNYLMPHDGRAALKWVIVGGESEPGGKPRFFDKRWARWIQEMCDIAEVPFLFKQSSGRKSGMGRELDGKTYDGVPIFDLAQPEKPLVQKRMF